MLWCVTLLHLLSNGRAPINTFTVLSILGTLEKPSPVVSSHGYQRFMQCRYSSAGGSFGLLAPSNRMVICSAKPLISYLLTDFIKRYINKLIILLLLIILSVMLINFIL